jgi:hypothetical protein
MDIIHFHGNHHLGDTLISFIVLYNLKDFFEKNNKTVYFYMKNEHIDQMNDFIPIKGMQIFDISNKPCNSIELWDCNDYIFEPNGRKNKYSKMYSGLSQNRYYLNYFNIKLKELNIPISINRFCYEDEDLIYRYDNLHDKYKNIDILIINSEPLSGQYIYNIDNWNRGIKILNEKYKIVTTKKVNENILCTRDDNLKIKDIAAISTKVKVVIAINTGPLIGLFNKFTLMHVKKFYIFDNRVYLDYPNFEIKKKLRDISLKELDDYITKTL